MRASPTIRSLHRREAVTENVIDTTELVRLFGTRRAVDGVDLKVQKGEIYGLVGPSGAGKTTLIRMICGLLRPSEGRVVVLKKSVPREFRAIEARIGYMPQEHAVYRDLTLMENIIFFGRIYGMRKREIASRSEELLALMHMEDLREQRADRLSGGEKQRLSLACALLHEPELLLLDEPTIGLDPALRIEFWDHFDFLNRTGRTILLSTHYLAEAERCSRVGMMRRGRLIAEGTPEDLKSRMPTAGGSPSMEEVFLYITQHDEGGTI